MKEGRGEHAEKGEKLTATASHCGGRKKTEGGTQEEVKRSPRGKDPVGRVIAS